MACGFPDSHFWCEKSGFSVFCCSLCGSAFVWPCPTKAELNILYDCATYGDDANFNADYRPDGHQDAEKIVSYCARHAPGRRLLDIGAGEGIISGVAVRHGFRVTAIEPSAHIRERFVALNAFDPLPCFFDEKFVENVQEPYDVAVLSQVLEHLYSPHDIVRLLASTVRQGGIVFVGVPHFGSILSRLQGTNDMYVTPPHHVNFFSKTGLTRLFERNGFETIRVETVSKTPKRRIERALRVWPFSALGWRIVHAGLGATSLFGMGMVINAYFRRQRFFPSDGDGTTDPSRSIPKTQGCIGNESVSRS